jgi:hypothetical protein
MKKIENAVQLREEIIRLRARAKEQEKNIKDELYRLKEELKPANLVLNTFSSLTGINMNKKEFFKEGLAYALSVIIQRFVLKTEKKIEDRAYDFIDGLFEKIRKFMDKFTSHEAKREHRKEENENG